MTKQTIKQIVINALDDLKGVDIEYLDVRQLTDVMDSLVIVTGTSNRHVRSLAENAVMEAKKNDIRPLGVEGQETADWVLVDFGDLVLHVMLAETRSFYDLERLWSEGPLARSDLPTDQDN